MEECGVCKGKLKKQLLTYSQYLDGQFIIVENVPAWVCEQCGERFYDPEIVEKLQNLVWSQVKPVRTISVPVYDLQQAA